jgi:thiol:disulfide interchange protein DsbA
LKTLKEKMPKNAKIQRVPLGFNPTWKIFARVFYTAQSLGVLEQSHLALFDALHEKHIKFRSLEDVADWYVTNYKVDKETFLSTAKSFMIDGMVSKGNNAAIKMKVRNTPTLVINGKYFPEKKALGSNEALIDLTLFLIEKEVKNLNLSE